MTKSFVSKVLQRNAEKYVSTVYETRKGTKLAVFERKVKNFRRRIFKPVEKPGGNLGMRFNYEL